MKVGRSFPDLNSGFDGLFEFGFAFFPERDQIQFFAGGIRNMKLQARDRRTHFAVILRCGDQRFIKFLPDQYDPFCLDGIFFDKPRSALEFRVHRSEDFGRIDFVPEIIVGGRSADRPQRGIDRASGDFPDPVVLQLLVEFLHDGRRFPEHQTIMFVQQAVHIGPVVPGDPGEDIIVEVIIQETVALRFAIRSEDPRGKLFVILSPGARAHLRDARHGECGHFVGIIPKPDLAPEFLCPCFDFAVVQFFLGGIAFGPRTLFRHHDQDVVRDVEGGNPAVGTVGHHGDIPRNSLLFEVVRNGDGVAPDEFRRIVRIVFLIGGLALVAFAPAEGVLRHDVHVRGFCIAAPAVSLIRARRRDSADIGFFSLQTGTDVLVNFFQDAAGVTELSGVPRRRIVAPVAVALKGEIFGMRFAEAPDVLEAVEPVTARQVFRFEAQPVVAVQRFSRVDGGIAVFAFEIFAVPESGYLALGEIRPVEDVQLRNDEPVFFRHDGAEFAREIHPDARDPFQEIINAEQGSAFIELTPDAAFLNCLFRLCLRIVDPRNEDSRSVRADEERVPHQFCRVEFRPFAPFIDAQDERNLVFRHFIHDRNLFSEDFRKKRLEFPCRETGGLRGVGRKHDFRVGGRGDGGVLFSDPDHPFRRFGHSRRKGKTCDAGETEDRSNQFIHDDFSYI
ncbi:MAG: hypothetical protein BWY31_04215 [Lentisphaerae bacterium ADurb.Bin242]|nr:MAG: hypothetical protein BWY31_04215 [Lentisphaerae bacterium ADurb.Bin242]